MPSRSRSRSAVRTSATSSTTSMALKPNPEAKLRKFLVRATSAAAMLSVFVLVVWAGHVAVCASVILLQIGVFKELVRLRYREAREKRMPWFRSLQWAWFATGMGWAYGSSWLRAPMGTGHHVFITLRGSLPTLTLGATDDQSLFNYVSFGAYALVFMLSVLSLNEGGKGLYRYQLMQFMWTLGTMLVVVAQVKTTVYSIYSGLFWFVFPFSLVVANDTFAYLVGFTCGRKFIKRPFLSLSPNKTWEGFLGGGALTLIYAYHSVDSPLFNTKALLCSYTELSTAGGMPLFTHQLSCANEALFYSKTAFFDIKPIQLHALALALAASVLAPFGGFFASAIKRAFDIKDFDTFIPGHGGFMDRMDCQFLMMAVTYIHYSTFVTTPELAISLPQMLQALNHLDHMDKQKLFEAVKLSLS